MSGGCRSVSVLFSPSSSDLWRVAGIRGLVLVVRDLPEGETFANAGLTALSNWAEEWEERR